MDVLDEARFTELSERHRHELQVHSYRMLGNLEQAQDAVQEALLPARQRRCWLREVQGYWAETAEMLDMSIAAVTSALQRARATLAARVSARRAGSDVFLPFKLDVLRTGGGRIAEITTFDASLFDRFGLPPSLPMESLPAENRKTR